MVNLIETDLTSVDYTDENNKKHIYFVVPIVTFSDEKIAKNTQTEKKADRFWLRASKIFSKKFSVIEDIQLAEDENDPLYDFEDDQYVFVDLLSLSAIKTNERKDYNIGLRYVEEQEGGHTYIAHPFSDDFFENLDVDDDVSSVNSDIPFSHLESVYHQCLKYFKNRSKENMGAIHERQNIEKREAYINSNDEEQSNTVENNNFDDIESDSNIIHEESVTEQNNEADDSLQSDNASENNIAEFDNYSYEESDATDNEDEVELSEIEKLEEDLYSSIENMFPRIYLDNLGLDLEFKDNHHTNSTYDELEKLTINNIRKSKARAVERLEEQRQTLIRRLHLKTMNDLYQRFTEHEKIFNLASEESLYHNEYINIKEKRDEVINNAESRREDKFVELSRKLDEDIERRAKEAYAEEKARLEREQRPLVEEKADEFKDNLLASAEEIFNSQMESVNNDAVMTFESEVYGLVDNVLSDYDSEIGNAIKEFQEDAEKSTNEIINQYHQSMKEVQQQIQAIQKDHIQNETEFDKRVDFEVEKQTQSMREQNNQFKTENASLREELERLRKQNNRDSLTIENLQVENDKKNERIEIIERNERELKNQLMNNQNSLGYGNGYNNHSNFNNVVAPQLNSGEGNVPQNVVATDEKSVMPLKTKLKQPMMLALMAVSLGSVGLFGASSFENSQAQTQDNNVEHAIDNIDAFKSSNDAKHLTKDTTLTIRSNNRLKPTKVISSDKDNVRVKSNDGQTFTLKK